MAERIPAHGAMLITSPSEHETVYEMSVRIARAEYGSPKITRYPWLKVRVDHASNEYYLSTGVRIKRKDGA
jgi:hypothetical protein